MKKYNRELETDQEIMLKIMNLLLETQDIVTDTCKKIDKMIDKFDQ